MIGLQIGGPVRVVSVGFQAGTALGQDTGKVPGEAGGPQGVQMVLIIKRILIQADGGVVLVEIVEGDAVPLRRGLHRVQ